MSSALDASDSAGLRLDTQQQGVAQHNRQGSDGLQILSSPLGKDGGSGAEVDLKIPDKVDDYDVVGTLFKRRGGWGKHLGWKARAFTLYQGERPHPAKRQSVQPDRKGSRNGLNNMCTCHVPPRLPLLL